jgi:protein-S-isoprenylcysteine O-methyltransferase Ste14
MSGMLVYFVLPLAAAGRADWGRAWVFALAMTVSLVASILILRRANPDVLRARTRWHKGTKRFDFVFMAFYIVATSLILVVSGLDAGRRPENALGLWSLPVGLLLFLAGTALSVWVLSVNPFAEVTVRIQTDRGHRVITTGPYQYIRHPMYLGALIMFVGWPLLFASRLAFIPFSAVVVLLILRTALEDRTLTRELPGYSDYAQRTRYRLIPRVW